MIDIESPSSLPSAAAATAPVAIVGGGPIGLTLALLLARDGIDSVVCEARPLAAACADRRLLALSRGTLQALGPLLQFDAAGASAAAAAPALAPIRRVRVSSAGEFGATTLNAAEFGAPLLGATVRYGDLVEALDRAVAATPRIRLLRPVLVTGIAQHAGHVALRPGAGAPLQVSLLVRAEGQPPVAPGHGAAPGVSPEAADREPWAITADVHFDDLKGNSSAALRAGDAIERFTREGPLALLPAPGNAAAWSLVWCMRHAAARARLALDDAAFLAALTERLGHRMAAPVRVGPRASWPLRASALEHVREHRIVHVGNAAQTLHPVAGQGFNLGVRDCIALVDCLARQHPEGMHGPVPPSCAPHDANAGVRASRTGTPDAVLLALALHEARRRGDRRAIGAITAALPALFATPFAPLASARSLGLLALDTLFPLRRALGHLLMFGVRE